VEPDEEEAVEAPPGLLPELPPAPDRRLLTGVMMATGRVPAVPFPCTELEGAGAKLTEIRCLLLDGEE
jgi:hypothetical protein